jgi:FdhD protein
MASRDPSDSRDEVLRYEGGRVSACGHRPVAEFPLALTVNGVDLATLVASPHDLPALVTGFLRMQRLVRTREDIVSMGICAESGIANVTIRRTLPPRLVPTLTTGCGTGVVFAFGEDGDAARAGTAVREAGEPIPVGEIFALAAELARLAEGYRDRGGVHSAAVGEGGCVLLFAEDVGRHNTLDRIAGAALLEGVDLAGKVLVTSGRVSSEMAGKAALLGVAAIASRTSPTDLAVRMCREAGIALVGYLRGDAFNVYAHPERLAFPEGLIME